MQGASPITQKSIPEGVDQIFAMSRDIAPGLREDLAWGTYVLLRNTNSISVVCFQALDYAPSFLRVLTL